MGGSSSGEPKMSKLQALAAARRKKALDQKSGEEVEKHMAGISLSEKEGLKNSRELSSSKQPSRGFPLRKRKDSSPHEKAPPPPVEKPKLDEPMEEDMEKGAVEQAEPSAFASTMFSSPRRPPLSQAITHPYLAAITTLPANPFAGPSPDDVVIAAQSKGSVLGPKKKD